jgi:hypothetical protein
VDSQVGNDRGDELIDLQDSARISGGHAMCLYGYDEFGFYLVNSYGSKWRGDGRAIFTERMAATAMDVWAVRVT